MANPLSIVQERERDPIENCSRCGVCPQTARPGLATVIAAIDRLADDSHAADGP